VAPERSSVEKVPGTRLLTADRDAAVALAELVQHVAAARVLIREPRGCKVSR